MNDSRQRWDDKYNADPGLQEPASVLTEIEPLLVDKATVVDVAGGSGANAVWFAERGHPTTVVDVSPVGLAHAQSLAERRGVSFECVVRDLESNGMPPGRIWDVAFVHMFFDRNVLQALPASLSPGGLLVFVQPTVTNLERHEHPSKRFVLAEGEVEEIAASMARTYGVEILEAKAEWRRSERHDAYLIARVASPEATI